MGTLSVDGGIGGATVSSSSYYSRGGNGSKGRMYIKVYDVLNLPLAQNPSFCSTTGVAEINVLGGNAPYTFHWIESNETTNPATQLPLGSNTCEVTDSNLCKSRITVVLNYDSLVQNITLCKGEQITVGNNTYTEIGSYRDTIINVGGCYNSIITNITKFDLNVTNNNNMLQAKTGGNAYQWYNCDTDEPITGETSETFTPSKSGNYAVKITTDDCDDFSDCIEVKFVSVENIAAENIQVFPNPTHGLFTINAKEMPIEMIEITDISGRIIAKKSMQSSELIQLDIVNEPSGVYFIKITLQNKTKSMIKLIKN